VFRDLLDNPSARHPRELQDDSAKKFPSTVAGSNLKLLHPGHAITDDAVILIGVASYSVLDLELLDRVDQGVSRRSPRFKIYVFDMAAFSTFEDLEVGLHSAGLSFIWPHHKQWPPVRQTPIVLVSMAHQAIEFRQGVGPCQRLLEDLGVL
jgi:hypothetical protein